MIAVVLVSCSGAKETATETISSTSTPAVTQTVISPTLQISSKDKRPNIVYILADDMEADLVQYMPKTLELIGGQGATFTHFYVSMSLCCPSRATILCGQYRHNTKINGNKLPEGGFDKFYQLGLEQKTFAVWLQQAGYSTALFGKYLNEYPGSTGLTYIPPGWTEWYSPVKGNPYRNYNYTLNENGQLVDYQQDSEDYLTDVISVKTLDFVQRNAEANTPFLAYVAVYAPHTPSDPAPRHTGMFANTPLPRPPSFNEEDMSDKTQSYWELKQLGDNKIEAMDFLYEKRIESMQAVDEMVAAIVTRLNELGQLDNTYVIFTSDNGYHMGQHRLPQGKNTPFEEDVHVPFLIRGPGITPGSTVDALTGNVDMASTFAEMAGITPPDYLDGRSLMPLFGDTSNLKWRDAYLLERSGEEAGEAFVMPASHRIDPGLLEPADSESVPGLIWVYGSPYEGMRTMDYEYIEYEIGDIELYDMKNDPYQLNNIAPTADPVLLAMFHDWLAKLQVCSGDSCRTAEIQP